MGQYCESKKKTMPKRTYGGRMTRRQAYSKKARTSLYKPSSSRAVMGRLRSTRTRNYRTGGYLGIEYKFLDCAWNGANNINASGDGANGEQQPTSGCTGCFSCPAQGDGESQRDGRKYCIKSAWVSGAIDYSTVAGAGDVIPNSGIYAAIVLDTQANGATIDSEDIFINPSTQGEGMVPSPLRNLQNSKRFRILASQYIGPRDVTVGTDGTATLSMNPGAQPIVNLSWKGNIMVECTGTTADVASVSDNALHLVMYAADTTFTPKFKGKSRVRFVG